MGHLTLLIHKLCSLFSTVSCFLATLAQFWTVLLKRHKNSQKKVCKKNKFNVHIFYNFLISRHYCHSFLSSITTWVPCMHILVFWLSPVCSKAVFWNTKYNYTQTYKTRLAYFSLSLLPSLYSCISIIFRHVLAKAGYSSKSILNGDRVKLSFAYWEEEESACAIKFFIHVGNKIVRVILLRSLLQAIMFWNNSFC